MTKKLFLLKAERMWNSIRWKMLIIQGFFCVLSTLLILSFSIAVLNVVIRRESAYVIEERINSIVENSENSIPASLSEGLGCPTSSLPQHIEKVGAVVPGTPTAITLKSPNQSAHSRPEWLKSDRFSGIVIDRGRLEIRSYEDVQRGKCPFAIYARTGLDQYLLQRLSEATGLHVSNSRPTALQTYRTDEGMVGEITANFVPGSRRPVPVVATVRNWQTGLPENWVLCQVHLGYMRTFDDLGRMGLRPASWLLPLAGIAFALLVVYACGLFLSVRLSRQIVASIDGLSHAALRVGKGDFSVVVPVSGRGQLAALASSFNSMTRDLAGLREQERQTAHLEWEMTLAREVQRDLYSHTALVPAGINVWGTNRPARMVSGDLYEFFSFSNSEVGLLCADVSGKGVSAALVMAYLQALMHGRLLPLDQSHTHPSPAAFIDELNGKLQGRFGNSRYATMFYGEFDSRTNVLRYVNAGHCPAIVICECGRITRLSEGSLPVGLFPGVSYEEYRITLPKGSAVVVYTDGVTDALNAEGEAFGEERLLSCCMSLPDKSSGEAIGRFLASKVNDWAAGVEQSDDTTILVLAVA